MTMQKEQKFRFMALPSELRCHVYSYVAELVYKHIWPPITESPFGICTWPVLRLPTPFLLASKTIYQESVTELRRLNRQHPPTIILGPFTSRALPHSAFLDAICGSLADQDSRLSPECNADQIYKELTSWSDKVLFVRLGMHWEHVYKSLYIDRGYSKEDVMRFITHTMARIEQSSTKDVQIRLLLRGSSFNHSREGEDYAVQNLIRYKLRTPLDSRSAVEGLTIVPSPKGHQDIFFGILTDLRERGIAFKLEEPLAQDRRFLNRAGRSHWRWWNHRYR